MHDVICDVFTSMAKEASFHVAQEQLHLLPQFRHQDIVLTLSFETMRFKF
jgi:hypothetical protein